LFDLHQSMVTNEHQYVTKMALNASLGGFWEDFTPRYQVLSKMFGNKIIPSIQKLTQLK
jgi:hypothetical protein